MRRWASGLLVLALAGAAVLIAPGSSRAAPGDVVLCSVTQGGAQADQSCYNAVMSEDGRFVAFESYTSNLIPGTTPGRWHIYRKDTVTGEIVLCSRSAGGAEANGHSFSCDISADGSYVVFHSQATNLLAGSTTSGIQVFRKDLNSGSVSLCSSNSSGAQGNNTSEYASISSDGRYVAFQSAATNLTPGNPDVRTHVFRKDMTTGEVRTCSISSTGVYGNGASEVPSISSDGRYVAFQSAATNLIPGTATSGIQVFRKDVSGGGVMLCSSNSSGAPGDRQSYYANISADGRYVAFASRSGNLAPGTTPDREHVYCKDLQNGRLSLCSCAPSGMEGNNSSTRPALSADGRYVVFQSAATNLTTDANTGRTNVLRKDISTGEVKCCSISASGAKGNGDSFTGSISADGRFVGFNSNANNLVDGTTTANAQIFRKELEAYRSFYFAEGCTRSGFQEFLCLGNPGTQEVFATVTYLFSDAPSEVRLLSIPAGSRVTINVNGAVGSGRDVSIRVVSEKPCVAERPVYFQYGGGWTGGHDTVGAPRAGTSWYFAEGYTGPGFEEWVCVLNPGEADANLTFRFQTGEGPAVRVGYRVNAGKRATFKINDVLGANRECSLLLESDQPVVAERPMYFDYLGTTGSRHWTGGHCVTGIPWMGREYHFAEGYTGEGFEEWLTLQNPNPMAVSVTVFFYYAAGGSGVTSYGVPAGSRRTVYVPGEVGTGREVSIRAYSSHPFLAERPMYFRYSGTGGWGWTGGHCVIGARQTASVFYFAEGYTGPGFEEWLCIENPGPDTATVGITYYIQGAGATPEALLEVPSRSRRTVLVNTHAGANLQLSCRVRVRSGPRVVVERPMYFNYNGWTGGHDVVGYTP